MTEQTTMTDCGCTRRLDDPILDVIAEAIRKKKWAAIQSIERGPDSVVVFDSSCGEYLEIIVIPATFVEREEDTDG